MPDHITETNLNLYLDGELGEQERGAVALHLNACANCREDLARLEAAFHAIESLGEIEFDRDLAPEVLSRLRSKPTWVRSATIGQLAVAAAAGLTLLIVLGAGTVAERLTNLAVELSRRGAALEFDLRTQLGLLTEQLGAVSAPEIGPPALLWAVAAGALMLLVLGNGAALIALRRR